MTCFRGHKACRAALSALLAVTTAGCSTGGFNGSSQSLGQSLRAQQRQDVLEQRKADRKAKLPHPVSVAHEGDLVPFDGLESNVAGKTLYLQTPIVQNGQLQKVEVAPIYFAPGGQAYSSDWASRPWQASGNSLCITANQQPSCMKALTDSTGQAFLLGAGNLLVQVGKITEGDVDNVKQAYQKAQQQQQEAEDKIMSFVAPLLLAGLMSGGGGGGGGAQNPIDTSRYPVIHSEPTTYPTGGIMSGPSGQDPLNRF